MVWAEPQRGLGRRPRGFGAESQPPAAHLPPPLWLRHCKLCEFKKQFVKILYVSYFW